jgi:hypothetical protein
LTDSDWRLQGQEAYLTGVTLIRRHWRQSRPNWDHDHCEFCFDKFGASDDFLQEGWTTPDEYRWVCDRCFGDFRAQFNWRIGETPASRIDQ